MWGQNFWFILVEFFTNISSWVLEEKYLSYQGRLQSEFEMIQTLILFSLDEVVLQKHSIEVQQEQHLKDQIQ